MYQQEGSSSSFAPMTTQMTAKIATAVYIITISVSQIGNIAYRGNKARPYKQTRCLMNGWREGSKGPQGINRTITMADSDNVFVFGQWAFVESSLFTG